MPPSLCQAYQLLNDELLALDKCLTQKLLDLPNYTAQLASLDNKVDTHASTQSATLSGMRLDYQQAISALAQLTDNQFLVLNTTLGNAFADIESQICHISAPPLSFLHPTAASTSTDLFAAATISSHTLPSNLEDRLCDLES